MSFRTFSSALWYASGLMIFWIIAAALRLPYLPPIGDLLTRPDFKDNLPPILILLLFAWVLFEVSMKHKQVRREQAAVAEFQSILEKSDLSAYSPKPFDREVPRAIRRAHLVVDCTRRGDTSSLHEAVPGTAALDAGALAASYTPLQVYAWILPVLGFIGTASGMASAIGGFKDALRGSGQGQVEALAGELAQRVIPGLAGAFETTILALVAALVAYLCTSALRVQDQEALDQLDRLCVVLLTRIPQPQNPDGKELLNLLQQISDQVRDVLKIPFAVEGAAKAIGATAEALNSSSNQFESAVNAIGITAGAMTSASRHTETAATALKEAAEALKLSGNKPEAAAPAKDTTLNDLTSAIKDLIAQGERPVTFTMSRGAP